MVAKGRALARGGNERVVPPFTPLPICARERQVFKQSPWLQQLSRSTNSQSEATPYGCRTGVSIFAL